LCGLRPSNHYPKQLRRIETEILTYDAMMVPSEYVKNTFVERGYPETRIFVNPFGVDLSVFRPPRSWEHRKSGKFIVVCVAQVSPRKGIRVLLEAWRLANFNPNEAELRIIGRVADEMKHFVASAPLGVYFTGALSKGTVVNELQNASVYILPTIEEGFAYAILEAMSTGCVVLTTPPSGATSIIVNGVNGFIHESSAVTAFSDSLLLLSRDGVLRERMGLAAIQSVKCGFTWDDYCSRALVLYKRVLSGEFDSSVKS
jgi:glycosyltransferase involved in cell wall biosynthesis